MQRYGLHSFGVSAGRTLAGFIFALLLAVLGGWAGLIFNLTIGYPWPLLLHHNIHMMGIALGASLGAYGVWMDPTLRWYWILITIGVILVGATAGMYLGLAYGPGVDPTYWWSRFAVDNTIHLGAAVGALIVSTAIGLAAQGHPDAWIKIQWLKRRLS